MRLNALVVALVALCMVSLPSCASAQQDQPQFSLVQSVHINPGKSAEFEQARKQYMARLAEANVTFGSLNFANDRDVYTTLIPLSSMADLDEYQTQLNAVSAGDPTLAREAIHHIDSAISQPRPELSYTPNPPRVPDDEVGFYRGLTFYLKFGTANEAAEIMQQIRTLYEDNDLQNAYTVSSKVTGSGPDLSVFIRARDAADFYTENQRVNELIGESLSRLGRQLNALSYRVNRTNATRKAELDYQPPN